MQPPNIWISYSREYVFKKMKFNIIFPGGLISLGLCTLILGSGSAAIVIGLLIVLGGIELLLSSFFQKILFDEGGITIHKPSFMRRLDFRFRQLPWFGRLAQRPSGWSSTENTYFGDRDAGYNCGRLTIFFRFSFQNIQSASLSPMSANVASSNALQENIAHFYNRNHKNTVKIVLKKPLRVDENRLWLIENKWQVNPILTENPPEIKTIFVSVNQPEEFISYVNKKR